MCGKVHKRIQCDKHEYPISEARYKDRTNDPLPCFRNEAFYEGYIDALLGLTEPPPTLSKSAQ